MSKEAQQLQAKVKATWGRRGGRNGEFGSPGGLAVSRHGQVYVSDEINDRIQCFDSNGQFLSKWGRKGTGPGEFDLPKSLAIGICDGLSASVVVAMCDIPTLYAFPPGVLPISAAYLGNECIFVVDFNNNRIQVFALSNESDPSFLASWRVSGPQDVVVDTCDTSTVWVLDLFSSRLRQWQSTNVCDSLCTERILPIPTREVHTIRYTLVREILSDELEPHDASDLQWKQMSINSTGHLYSVDYGGRMYCWRPQYGTLSRYSICPEAGGVLATDSWIFVSDVKNDGVMILTLDGKVAHTFGTTGKKKNHGKAPEFKFPTKMAMGADGNLLVVDKNNHRIVSIAITTAPIPNRRSSRSATKRQRITHS